MGDGVVCIGGIILSTVANYCINNHAASENIVDLLKFIDVLMLILFLIFIFISCVAKANLPDNLDYKSYKLWSLKEYSESERNVYKKYLAKIYIFYISL